MKKHFLLVALIILSTFLACKREVGPEVVMKRFANHFVAGEYTEAMQYGTPSTVQLLEMMEALASVGFYLPDEDEQEFYSLKDFDCQVSGNSAVCYYLEYGEMVDVNLVKIEGKWLVDIPLDDLYDDQWYDEEDWYDDEEDLEFSGTERELG